MNNTPVLKVQDIHKSFGNVEVLRGVSFEVEKGETKVFIGPSGTGKSTLLKCINQLTIPDRGNVWLNGREIVHSHVKINLYRQQMGMVFQNFFLFDHLTAVRNVEISLIKVKRMNRKEAREKAMEELSRVGMADKANSYPAELSGGQAQRLSIARALAMDPEVMLFDEPTSSLDPELTGEVLDVMRKLARGGMTMVVVTHEMGFARWAANEIFFMDEGVILESGPPAEMFTRPRFERTRRFISRMTELYAEEQSDG